MLDDTISSGSFGSDLQRIDASIVEKLEMLSTAQSREAQLSDGAAALRMSRASMDAQLSAAKAVGASIAAEQQAEHKRFLILEDEFGHTSQQLQFLCCEKARLKASQRDFQSSNQKVKAQMQSTCAQIELHFDLDPHWGGRLQERKRGLDSLQESAMEHATFEVNLPQPHVMIVHAPITNIPPTHTCPRAHASPRVSTTRPASSRSSHA
jgi:hypothetical protein